MNKMADFKDDLEGSRAHEIEHCATVYTSRFTSTMVANFQKDAEHPHFPIHNIYRTISAFLVKYLR